MWCGISASRVYGPYFFENDNATVTVTGERYRSMITEFLIPELERQNVHHTWFQQDGATAHTARETMTLLKDCFPNRLISRFGDIPWPPRSPDLTPCDFFLWGYLKSRVYVSNPTNLLEKQHLSWNSCTLARNTNEGYENNKEKSHILSKQPWRSFERYYIQKLGYNITIKMFFFSIKQVSTS